MNLDLQIRVIQSLKKGATISHALSPSSLSSPSPSINCFRRSTCKFTMQETLHLSSSAASSSFTTPKFPSISRPQQLHFHSPPSSSKPVSLPPIPHPPAEYHTFPPPYSKLLQEKLLYLDSQGIDSLQFLTIHPPILSTHLSDIRSTVDFLHHLGLTAIDIRRACFMCPEILTNSLHGVLIPAVNFLLREAQVDQKDLRHVIHRRPRLLTRSVETQLRPTLYFLQSAIGINDVTRCATLLSCSVETKFMPRLDYFLKVGFSKTQGISMFRRFPSLFCYSVKDNLEPKFNYFVVEMGRELGELVDFPQYFSFSLENRIKHRHKECAEKEVFMSLPVMLKSSETEFRKRMEVCCNTSMPVKGSPLWCKSENFDDNVT